MHLVFERMRTQEGFEAAPLGRFPREHRGDWRLSLRAPLERSAPASPNNSSVAVTSPRGAAL